MNEIKDHIRILSYLPYLLEEKSVTKAAKKAFISQPMMSHALKELRQIFNDPLFIQKGKKMIPTKRAETIGEALEKGFGYIEQALQNQRFDPQNDEKEFTIMLSDYVSLIILPSLINDLSINYPKLSISTHPLHRHMVFSSLEKGDVDFAIGYFEDLPHGIQNHILFQEEFVCISKKNHPKICEPLTLDAYLNLSHVIVNENEGAIGFVNRELEKINLNRKISYTLPFFTVAPFIVTNSEAVIATNRRIATFFASIIDIDIHELPIEIPGIPLKLIWHHRHEDNDAHKWLRKKIQTHLK